MCEQTRSGISVRCLAVAAAVGAMISCSSSPSEPPGISGSPDPGRTGAAFTVTLGVGESTFVDGTELTFQEVRDDSRCPVDVTCVWAGDAVVVLDVRVGDSETPLELHVNLEPRAAVVAGHRVALERLEPAPRSEARIDPGDYRVTLRVSPAAS